jgi:hypothetical protein
MMTARWDLMVRNKIGMPVLAVEVKAILNSTPAWAAQFRHNLSAFGDVPDVPFLLMALPDRLYLWNNTKAENDDVIEPAYSVDARPLFQPYLQRAGTQEAEINGSSLELIITSWLTSVMLRKPEELNKPEQWLLRSGLYDAIAEGKIDYEVVV